MDTNASLNNFLRLNHKTHRLEVQWVVFRKKYFAYLIDMSDSWNPTVADGQGIDVAAAIADLNVKVSKLRVEAGRVIS